MQQCPLRPHCQGEQLPMSDPWGEKVLEQETDRVPLPVQSLNLGTAQSIYFGHFVE